MTVKLEDLIYIVTTNDLISVEHEDIVYYHEIADIIN